MRVLRGVVYMTKSSGPRTEPWGLLDINGHENADLSLSIFDRLNGRSPIYRYKWRMPKSNKRFTCLNSCFSTLDLFWWWKWRWECYRCISKCYGKVINFRHTATGYVNVMLMSITIAFCRSIKTVYITFIFEKAVAQWAIICAFHWLQSASRRSDWFVLNLRERFTDCSRSSVYFQRVILLMLWYYRCMPYTKDLADLMHSHQLGWVTIYMQVILKYR